MFTRSMLRSSTGRFLKSSRFFTTGISNTGRTIFAGEIGLRFSSRQFSSTAKTQYSSGKPQEGSPRWRDFFFVGIACFGLFAFAVDHLERKNPQKPLSEEEFNATIRRKRLAFQPGEVSVVFVLGGPGAGKGTQCAKLTKDYGFVHLSAGDLLRAEQQREGSKYGELIQNYIKEGKIVPQEITIALLKKAMRESLLESEGKKNKFLIDGFPRKMDQAMKFEEEVAVSDLVLFFECPEEVMMKRLLKRGETSGRIDDNAEAIVRRFKTFTETSMPVVEYFETVGKVVKLSCEKTPDEVYADVKKALHDKMGLEL